MSALSYNEARSVGQTGLGYVEAIAALVGGLAQAGAGIYQTTALEKATKKQQKLNQAALQVDAELRRREQDLIAEQRRRESLAAQARSILTSQSAQVGLSVVAILGVTFLVTRMLRK